MMTLEERCAYLVGTKLEVEPVCPMCGKPAPQGEVLHEEDGLCLQCEGEWVEFTQEIAS